MDIIYLSWQRFQKEEYPEASISVEKQNYPNRSEKIQDTYLFQENWKDSIALSDLVKDGSILVLRIPLVSCQECKFSELDNLRILSDRYDIRKLCALITVNTARDLKALTLAFGFKFLKLGSVKSDILFIREEKQNRPFYFVLNPDLQANMFYFPDQDKKNTFEYFKKINSINFEK